MNNIYFYKIPYRNKKNKKRTVLHIPDKLYRVILFIFLILTSIIAVMYLSFETSEIYCYISMGVLWFLLFTFLFFVESDTMQIKREKYLQSLKNKRKNCYENRK